MTSSGTVSPKSECSDQMKDSLAVALKHSCKQAQCTHNHRTASQKKALASELAQSRAEQLEGEEQDLDDKMMSQHEVRDFVSLE